MCVLPPKNTRHQNSMFLSSAVPQLRTNHKNLEKSAMALLCLPKKTLLQRMPLCRWTLSPFFRRLESDRILQNEEFKVT